VHIEHDLPYPKFLVPFLSVTSSPLIGSTDFLFWIDTLQDLLTKEYGQKLFVKYEETDRAMVLIDSQAAYQRMLQMV